MGQANFLAWCLVCLQSECFGASLLTLLLTYFWATAFHRCASPPPSHPMHSEPVACQVHRCATSYTQQVCWGILVGHYFAHIPCCLCIVLIFLLLLPGRPTLIGRFDIYVCTHANREYALEVWRLLDINGAIIPHEQRQSRIISVPRGQNKTLLGVLSGRKSSEVTSLHSEGSIGEWMHDLSGCMTSLNAFTE
eukprot:scaffold116602_cov17-Tisochrysis_lutea.AAC.1